MLTGTDRRCAVEPGGLVAHCRVGRGTAMVIADADFLNVAGEGALDGPTADNLDLLMAHLAAPSPVRRESVRLLCTYLSTGLFQIEQAWNEQLRSLKKVT